MSNCDQTCSRVVLARRPQGSPVELDFRVEQVSLAKLEPGEVRIASKFLSIDPYVRCLMDETSPYGKTLEIGDIIVGDAVSIVTETADESFPVGTWVVGRTGWSTMTNVNSNAVRSLETWISDPSTALSALGNTGLTAYIGVTLIGAPCVGETVLVTGASGGVGIIAVQLLKLAGCDVIAIAGSSKKADLLRNEIGITKVIDYKASPDIAQAIAAMAPDGVDLYFDNVGGPISEAVYQNLAVGGRVVLCGEASQYNTPGSEYNPRLYGPLMAKRASIAAFLVSDFETQFSSMRKRMQVLLSGNRLKDFRDIVDGIEAAPLALISMMRGENLGKRIVSTAKATGAVPRQTESYPGKREK